MRTFSASKVSASDGSLSTVLKYEGHDGQLEAYVKEFKPLGVWNGQYCVQFYSLGSPDNDYRGTYGTGMKVYNSKQSAIDAAKRYVHRWD